MASNSNPTTYRLTYTVVYERNQSSFSYVFNTLEAAREAYTVAMSMKPLMAYAAVSSVEPDGTVMYHERHVASKN